MKTSSRVCNNFHFIHLAEVATSVLRGPQKPNVASLAVRLQLPTRNLSYISIKIQTFDVP